MSTTWIVCYQNTVNRPICWDSNVWEEWLKSWAKSRIVHDRLKNEVNIPCPNYNWNKTLSSMDLINSIGISEFESINEMYTDLYLTNTQDISKCPNQKWNYAGVILPETWDEFLQWPEWDYTWKEYTQMSNLQKIFKSCKDLFQLNSDHFSYVKQVFTGSSCPKWGIVIWKDGGWNHMVCQKWNYEFWWLWFGHYSGYQHTDESHWYLRKIITFILLWTLILSSDYYLTQKVPTLGMIQYEIYQWGLYAITPNFFTLFEIVELIISNLYIIKF